MQADDVNKPVRTDKINSRAEVFSRPDSHKN